MILVTQSAIAIINFSLLLLEKLSHSIFFFFIFIKMSFCSKFSMAISHLLLFAIGFKNVNYPYTYMGSNTEKKSYKICKPTQEMKQRDREWHLLLLQSWTRYEYCYLDIWKIHNYLVHKFVYQVTNNIFAHCRKQKEICVWVFCNKIEIIKNKSYPQDHISS